MHDERRGGCFCPDHPNVAATGQFYLKFGRAVNNLSFRKYDKAMRTLTGMRHEWDNKKFDERDYQPSNPLGFSNLADEFIIVKEQTGMKTIGNIKNYMRRASDHWGDRNVKAIRKKDIRNWLYSIPNISEKTRHNYMSTIRDFFYNFLVEDEEILTVTQVPKMPKVPFDLGYRTRMSIEDREIILDEIKRQTYHLNPKIWLGIDVACCYPVLRPGDLRRLRESNIDTETAVLTFERPTKRRNETIRLRILDFHNDLFKELRARYIGLPHMKFFRHTPGTSGIPPETPFGEHYFWKWWKKACAVFGVTNVDFYGGSRHSTVTETAKRYGRKAAKNSSGHGKTNKAFDRYCEVSDDAYEVAKLMFEKRLDAQVLEFKHK